MRGYFIPAKCCLLSLKRLPALSTGSFLTLRPSVPTFYPVTLRSLNYFKAVCCPVSATVFLARPDGSEWTSWSEFLTTCKRFADAELRSRELPAKALETVSAAAAATLAKGKRPRPSSEPQLTRLAKKTRPPANSSRQPQPQLTAAQRAENDARTRVISRWCS